MCYVNVKRIEELGNGYEVKDFLNPHKDEFEYLKGDELVTITPDYTGYANGDIVIKFNNEVKIRYHLRDEVWVNDTNGEVLFSIRCVRDTLNLSDKEWELFLNAVKECNNYKKSGLNVDAFLPKPEVFTMEKYVDRVCVHNVLDPLKGWFKTSYSYSYKDRKGKKNVYIVSNGFAVHDENWNITFYGSFGDKTKKLIESLLKNHSIKWCSLDAFEMLKE